MKLATTLLISAAAFAQAPMPPPQVPTAAASKPAAGRAGGHSGTASGSYKDLRYGARRAPQLPEIKRFQLSNGMKVLLAEDHETPVIQGTAMVRTGSAFDPPGREGLANLTAALMRGGGTRQRTPEQVDDELEGLGATVESSIAESMGTVTLFAFEAKLAPALAIFRDVLTAPAFRSDRLDLAKSAMFKTIARRNDDPAQLMRREFLSVIRGKENPLGRRPEYASIAAIQRANVEGFYRRYYIPANTLLVFSGDFDAEAMKGALEALFGEWKAEPQAAPEWPKAVADAPGGAFLASKPDARQSYIAFGRSGLTYRDPDAAALEVAGDLLAGGPQSRLARRRVGDPGQDMRVEAAPGLPYSASFTFLGSTMPGATNDTVAAAVEELQKLRSAEPTEDEVRAAREAVQDRLCLGADNKAKAAFTAASAEYYGYPAEYLQQYWKAVGAVTRADVLRVAKERLDPAKLTLMVVSNLRAVVDPRTVTAAAPIDLTISAAGGATAVAAASPSSEEARKLLQRAQEAAGGAERLAAVKDMRTKTAHTLVRGGEDNEVDQWIAPAMLREDGTSSRLGRLIRFTDGSGGWISNGYNSAALAGANLRQVLGDTLRQFIPLLLSDRLPGRVLKALDDQTIEIVKGEDSVRVVFDPATGLPAEIHYDVPTERQPMLMQEAYSDYRDVNGIKLPFRVVTTQDGQKYADGQVTELTLNQGLKPEVLQKRP